MKPFLGKTAVVGAVFVLGPLPEEGKDSVEATADGAAEPAREAAPLRRARAPT